MPIRRRNHSAALLARKRALIRRLVEQTTLAAEVDAGEAQEAPAAREVALPPAAAGRTEVTPLNQHQAEIIPFPIRPGRSTDR